MFASNASEAVGGDYSELNELVAVLGFLQCCGDLFFRPLQFHFVSPFRLYYLNTYVMGCQVPGLQLTEHFLGLSLVS